jgi:hypothetical protein
MHLLQMLEEETKNQSFYYIRTEKGVNQVRDVTVEIMCHLGK